MKSYKKLLISLLPILLLSVQSWLVAEGRPHSHPSPHPHDHKFHKKLFVFGDSYADTGNIDKALSRSWKYPYGITFPGMPTGRFSDGRVLTDYIVKYLRVKRPISYRLTKSMPNHIHLLHGMNFAFGGSGVFDTLGAAAAAAPNMTTQIDLFQNLIQEQVYTDTDLANSVAFVSVAGNDYSNYLETKGSTDGILDFINEVVNQTRTNLQHIHGLGVNKIAVGGLQPLGCIPESTASSSFKSCDETVNGLVFIHNNLLSEAVSKLNQETEDHSTFVILNLYDSFMTVLNQTFQNQLKPCCLAESSEYLCGSVDENNVKKYTVCDNPRSAFFWDTVHPTQAGWHAVINNLQTTTAFQQLQY